MFLPTQVRATAHDGAHGDELVDDFLGVEGSERDLLDDDDAVLNTAVAVELPPGLANTARSRIPV